MPVRQIRKNVLKHKHSRKSRTHKSRLHKSRTHKSRKYLNKQKQTKHRGGSTGMPPAYYGACNAGYYASGSPKLSPASKQNPVSRGVLSSSGSMAGPNMYPMMGGEHTPHHTMRSIKKTKKAKSQYKRNTRSKHRMRGGNIDDEDDEDDDDEDDKDDDDDDNDDDNDDDDDDE